MMNQGDNSSVMPPDGLRVLDSVVAAMYRRRSWIFVTALLCSTLVATSLIALLDFLVPLSGWVRLVLLAALFIGLVLAAVRCVRSGRPRREDTLAVALHLEQHRPALRGWLAAAVDLRRSRSDSARTCVEGASDRLTASGPIRVDRSAPLLCVLVLFVLLAGISALFALQPVATTTAATRLLLPLGSTQWPPRTSVESNMGEKLVHGQGIPLPVSARNTTPDGEHETVEAVLRVSHGSGDVVHMTQPLIHQGSDLHQALIDLPQDAVEVSLHFTTEDAKTSQQVMEIRPLPQVSQSSITVAPPWTHDDVLEPVTLEATGDLPSLQNSVLVGSTITVNVNFNSVVVSPPEDVLAATSWAAKHLGWSGAAPPRLASTPTQWSLKWVADETRQLRLLLEDPDALQALVRPQLELTTQEDRRPLLDLRLPAHDLRMPPSGMVRVIGTAQDDYPLHTFGFEAIPQAGSCDAWQVVQNNPGTHILLERELSLESLSARPGDSLKLTAFAVDRGDASTGRRVVHSKSRVVQVVSPEQFIDDLQAVLAESGERVRALQHRQESLLDASMESRWTPADQADQRRIATDVRSLERRVVDLGSELSASRVDSPATQLVIDEAVLVLREAADLTSEGGALGADTPRDNSASVFADRIRLQSAIRDTLRSLADRMLDDQEQWLARRSMRDLLERQRALQNRLAEHARSGDAVPGRDARAISEDQSELSRSVSGTIDALRRAGSEQVADALEDSHVAAEMQRAADETFRGRLGLARAAQATATKALEELHSSLLQAKSQEGAQIAVLQRRLADLHTLLQRLLERQEGASVDLSHTDGESPQQTMVQRLQRIRRGMLTAVQRAIRSAFDSVEIQSTLRTAASFQSDAVLALLSDPPQVEPASVAVEAARDDLQRAIELVESASGALVSRDHEQAQARLVTTVQALAQRQAEIQDQTASAMEDEQTSTRRRRFELRRIGVHQRELTGEISNLAADSELLKGSTLAGVVVSRAAETGMQAADLLDTGQRDDRSTILQQRVVRDLQHVANAIQASSGGAARGDTPFSSEPQAGGASAGAAGQSAGGIPPLAELRLLRAMQADLLDQTREAISRSDEQQIATIAHEQRDLAQIGASLVESVASGGAAGSSGVRHSQDLVPEFFLWSEDPKPIPPSGDLPSLDELLGLQAPGSGQLPMPPVSGDSLQALSTRLAQAAEALDESNERMAARLQEDALERIDALLRQAMEQTDRGQSSSSSTSSTTDATSESGERATGASSASASSGRDADGEGEAAPRSPKRAGALGGALEHRADSWGNLPPRLRAMLEQGRRDGSSVMYADICGRYFQTLLEAPE